MTNISELDKWCHDDCTVCHDCDLAPDVSYTNAQEEIRVGNDESTDFNFAIPVREPSKRKFDPSKDEGTQPEATFKPVSTTTRNQSAEPRRVEHGDNYSSNRL